MDSLLRLVPVSSPQLELDLGDERVRVPWGGRSPRDLTRVQIGLFLEREREEHGCFLADPRQYDLFRAAITGRPQYGGAPLLLPLPRR